MNAPQTKMIDKKAAQIERYKVSARELTEFVGTTLLASIGIVSGTAEIIASPGTPAREMIEHIAIAGTTITVPASVYGAMALTGLAGLAYLTNRTCKKIDAHYKAQNG
ncbi:MAG: hypothetical protein PHE27_04900 [Alphaproteobacteria bacterium]|nr:hypothetical protein [Alphaproteobacteria bacterium]